MSLCFGVETDPVSDDRLERVVGDKLRVTERRLKTEAGARREGKGGEKGRRGVR